MVDLTKYNSKEIDDDGEAYDFPLFSKRYSSQSTVPATQNLHRISLRSPTPKDSELGFLISQRPNAYYFAPPASPEKLERYRETAVTGEDVKQALQQKWPGFELPWRLKIIKITPPIKTPEPPSFEEITPSPKKRAGKKRRIAIRKKTTALARMESIANRSQTEKETAWKEKQARKNRLKKVRKKEKKKRLGKPSVPTENVINP